MAQDDAIRAMLVSVPGEDLAAVLMTAFGDDNDLTEAELVKWLCRKYPNLAGNTGRLETPVREALQVLEHAELIYVSKMWDAHPYFRATRLGLLTLDQGDASVRQCIEDRIAAPAPAVGAPAGTPPWQSTAQRLQELEALRATGAISNVEYSAKREQVINDI
jgi:hypothetical protein